jgi:hypothetical protein
VSCRLEEFDLDVRLHGTSVERNLQADTEKEECARRTDENTCDGVAVTCNTCTPTCGGDTQCESARMPDITQMETCCPGTNETCDQQVCHVEDPVDGGEDHPDPA